MKTEPIAMTDPPVAEATDMRDGGKLFRSEGGPTPVVHLFTFSPDSGRPPLHLPAALKGESRRRRRNPSASVPRWTVGPPVAAYATHCITFTPSPGHRRFRAPAAARSPILPSPVLAEELQPPTLAGAGGPAARAGAYAGRQRSTDTWKIAPPPHTPYMRRGA